MRISFSCLLLLLSSLYGIFVSCQDGWTPVEGRIAIPNFGHPKGGLLSTPHQALSNIEIVLNGGEYTTLTTVNGEFIFLRVQPGVYSLDVNSVDYTFSSLKLKVSEDMLSSKLNISVIEYKFPGAKKLPAAYPIFLVALTKNFYIPVKEPFSLYKIVVGNPMMLMMLFSVVAVFALPAMMKNMDPEDLKKMQERSRTDPNEDPMKMLQSMMGMQAKDNDDE